MRARRGAFAFLALLLVAGLGLVLPATTLAAPAQAASGDGTLKIRVVREVNANAVYNSVLEYGIKSVVVRVSDSAGHSVDITTDGTGVATLPANATLDGGKYRVEVLNPKPKLLYPAVASETFAVSTGDAGITDGAKIGSSVMFVDLSGGKSASATTGFWTGADYCQSNPELVGVCQPPGILGAGALGIPGDYNGSTIYKTGYRQFSSPGDLIVGSNIATANDTGAIYGLGVRRQDKRVFSGAYAKRAVWYKPGNRNPGNLFVTGPNGGTSLFATVPGAGTTAHSAGTLLDGQDIGFNKAVGKEGLGDVDVTSDGKWVYVVNLKNRDTYVYDASKTSASLPNAIINTSTIQCASGTWRPMALGENDGQMHIGGVCDDASKAMVFAYDLPNLDPAAFNVTLTPTFTKVMDQSLKYGREWVTLIGNPTCTFATWNAWADTLPLQCAVPGIYQGWPQPMLSDINFRGDGAMMLSFRDRTVDQYGTIIFATAGIIFPTFVTTSPGGDLNIACLEGGSYVMDENGGCKGESFVNPLGNEKFWDNSVGGIHAESLFGGAAYVKTETSIVTNMLDPQLIGTQGITNLDVKTGMMQADPLLGIGNRTRMADFGKAQNLGDLEAMCDLAPIQIGNYVWKDTDNDGVQDPDEAPIAGVTVELWNASGTTKLATTTTSAAGEYYFDSVNDGLKYETDYVIRIPTGQAPLAGLTATQADAKDPIASNPDAVDSDGTVVGSYDQIKITTGTAGQNNHTYDFGFGRPLVSIGDYVWYDDNRDGLQSAGELPVANVTVKLLDANGNPVLDSQGNPRTTTTDANGYYYFADLKPSTQYIVEFVKPSGTVFTTQNVAGGDDAKDSDADVTTGRVSVTTPATGNNLTEPNKADDPTIDAGLVRKINLILAKKVTSAGPYNVGSTVTYELTPGNEGPADAIKGWSVTDIIPTGMELVSMSGTNYTCTVATDKITGTCTSAVGLKAGASGAPILVTAKITLARETGGVYHNVAYVSPATNEVAETNPLVIPTRDTTNTATTPTDNDAQADVSLQPKVSIGDYVWYDTNRDGQQTAGEAPVPGVVVNLYKDANNDGVLSPSEKVGQTTTDANGYYYFQSLDPSTAYVVEFVKPAGTVFTVDNQGPDVTDSDADRTTGRVNVTTPATGNNLALPGRADNPTIDAGLIKLVSMGDYVWYDDNRDGLQTAGELPVEGVTVKLLDAAGNPVKDSAGVARTTTTDANGFYWFTDLLPGTDYQVQFVKPANTIFTTANVAGGDEAKDSDANVTTGIAPFKTTDTGSNLPGANVTDEPRVDAGLVRQIDLSIKKALVTQTTVNPGMNVTFTVTPRNEGPADAIKGWSVTEVPQPGLTITAMSGDGYTCTVANLTCVAADGLKAKTDGKPITVTAKVDATFKGAMLKNVAYISPAAGEITETNPLVVPKWDTDTVKSTTNNDAEAYVPVQPLVSVGDYVWYDTNRNGLQDNGELPVTQGVVVTLFDADGKQIAQTLTDENGYYSFVDLKPGATYTIQFGEVPGYGFTSPNTGDDAMDSDANPTTGKVTFTTPLTGNNSGKPGEADDPTIDAGYVKPLVSIGDYVWYDDNRDGLQTAGELPVANVTVKLLDANGNPVKDAQGNDRVTTTDANGYYAFNNLEPETTYQVQFVKPAGTVFTTANVAGGDDAKDSDANVDTGKVTFTTPKSGSNLTEPTKADDPTIDAGLVRKINLVLAKKVTSAGPYQVGSTVTYELTPGNEGPADAIKGWSVTDIIPTGMELVSMSGTNYTCTVATDKITGTCTSAVGLKAGASGAPITVTAKITLARETGGVYHNVAYVSPATNEVAETNPLVIPTRDTTNTATTPTDNDAQADVSLQPKVSIGDYVWYDTNRDGIQDATESPVPNVVVNLYKDANNDGVLSPSEKVGQTTTNANGYYYFQSLDPSTEYVVEFVKPAGTVFTQANAGADDAKDSDANVTTGRVTVTTPATGNNLALPGRADNPTIDAGLIKLVSMGDYVWYDDNRDGLQTAGELPVEGVTVKLLDAAGNPVKDSAGVARTTTTDANGFYWFTDLLPGTDYQVQFVKPANTIFTTANVAGGDEAKDSDANVTTGIAPFKTTDTGSNLPGANVTDEPRVDAGLVRQIDLSITKERVGTGPVNPGGTVTFTVTPRNEGPADAIKGWSVTEVPQPGLTITAMSGDGYTCTVANLTCVAADGLKAKTDGKPITVTAKVDATFKDTMLKNVAYISPAAGEITETNPLVVPKWDTNTFTSPTNNDSQAYVPVQPLVSVGDHTWIDTNRNGLQDAGEPVLPGVLVTLYDSTGKQIAQTLTDDKGFYSFVDLVPGATYTIEFGTVPGYSFTDSNQGDDTKDSDANIVTGKVTFTAPLTGNNSPTTPDDPTIDAGYVKPLVSIGDYVWYDNNRDGLQTAGELPVGNVTVKLLDANGNPVKDAQGNPRVTVTDANGYYAFNNLEPETTYQVQFVKPAGTVFTTANVAGGDDAKDSDANVDTGKVTFTTPKSGSNLTEPTKADNPTIDAGLVQQINLVLAKTVASSGPYTMASEVTYRLVPENKGPADAIKGWSVTDLIPTGMVIKSMSGGANYKPCTIAADKLSGTCESLVGLKAGDKGAPITVVATFTAEKSGNYNNVAYVSPATGEVTETNPLVIPTRDANNTGTTPTDNDADAPVSLQPKVSIGDYVWYDTNRDGQQTAGEAPVVGVVVNLLDAAGNPVKDANGQPITTTTDANGFYSFTDLKPSTDYIVEFVKPKDTAFTTANAGVDDAKDSDANVNTGRAPVTTPATGNNSKTNPDNPTIDAGLIALEMDLKIVKTLVTTGTVYAGDIVEFKLAPENLGPDNARAGWSVTEVFDSTQLTLVSMDGGNTYICAGGTCTSQVGLNAYTKGAPITVKAKVNPEFTGTTIRNVTYVAPHPNDIPETNVLVVPNKDTDTNVTKTNNDSHVDVTVTPPLPTTINLNIKKYLTTTGTVKPGDTITFSLIPHNDGPADAKAGWTVTEVLPDGLSLVSMSGTGYSCTGNVCTAAAGLKALTDGPTITVTAKVDATFSGTTLRNVTYVSPAPGELVETNPLGTPPVKGTDTTKTTTDNDSHVDVPVTQPNPPSIDLKITKRNATIGVVRPGSQVTFTLTPENLGPDNAKTGWKVTEVVDPAQLTNVTMSGAGYVCDNAKLECVAQAGLAANTEGPVITVTATVNPAFTGQYIRNVTYITPGPGETTERNPLVVPPTGTNTDDTPTNNDSHVDVPVSPTVPPSIDLKITKRNTTTGVVYPGGQVSFTLTPENLGPDNAKTGWRVTEVVDPAQLTNVTMSGNGYVCDNAKLECVAQAGLAANSLGPVITVTATVNPAFTGQSIRNVTYITPGPGETTERNPLVVPPTGTNTDDTPTNNDSHVDVPVSPKPTYNLQLAKKLTISGPSVQPGDYVTWELTPNNVGPADALAGWKVTEVLPMEMTLVSMSGTGYTCDIATLTCTSSLPLAAGAKAAPIKVTTLVDPNYTGTSLRNVAIVRPSPAQETPETVPAPPTNPPAGTDTTGTPTDNDAHADVPVLRPTIFDLTIVKERYSGGTVYPGDNVTYTLTPINYGPDTAVAGWSVTEVMPAGLTLVSMSGAGYTCVGMTCTALSDLLPNNNGPVITVVAKVGADVTGTIRNVTYVVPNPKDQPGTETVPMSPTPPTGNTDTSGTPTNNDSHVDVPVTPRPTPTPEVTPTPVAIVTPTPVTSVAAGAGAVSPVPTPVPAVKNQGGSGAAKGTIKGAPPKGVGLPSTGSPVSPVMVYTGFGMLAAGLVLMLASRRRKAARR